MTKHIIGWLNAMCAVVVVTGLVMAGGALPQTEWGARLLLEWQNGGPLALDRAARVLTGVLGGVMCGWGVTLFAGFQAIEAVADARLRTRFWRIMLAGILVWFVVDSGLSIATGFALNAVMNAAFMLAFCVPIVASGAIRP